MANTKPIFLKARFRSGKGTAYYPSINEPDYKYNDAGSMNADIVVEADSPALERAKEAYELGRSEWPNLGPKGKKIADPPFAEQEDGTWKINIRRLHVAKSGKKQSVRIIGRNGKPLDPGADLFGHGSTIDVGYSVKAWHTPLLGFGVSFMPDVVMVLEAKFEGGAGLDAYGFEIDEDAPDNEPPPFDTDEDGQDDTSNGQDDPGEDW